MVSIGGENGGSVNRTECSKLTDSFVAVL